MVPSPSSRPADTFVSFAPQDQDLYEKLSAHLSNLRRQGLIQILSDSAISAGNPLEEISHAYIHRADIILILVSADFLASDQCAREVDWALQEYATRKTPIIPVRLRPVDLSGSPLEQFYPLPPGGKPVTLWEDLDQALTEVTLGIRHVAEDIRSQPGFISRPIKAPQLPAYMLPYRRSRFFTNRDELLERLRQAFIVDTSQTLTLALHGLGGIGKTLLANEYAYRYRQVYQAILWLHAGSREQFSADLLSATQLLGIPIQDDSGEHVRTEVLRRWLERHERWLVILDNLDERDFPLLDQLIPRLGSGHVLLTTHSSVTGELAEAISVPPLTVEEGASLLLRRAGLIAPGKATEEDWSQALAIAQEVEGYPLALDQAGAYIEETGCSLSDYLELYQEYQTALLGRRGRAVSNHPDPVTTTLSLTFKKIADVNPIALELLHLLAFLHPEALPDEMLSEGAAALSAPLRTLAASSLALRDALATLRRYSLIQQQADSTTLHIHRLVQTILREQLPKRQQVQFARQALRLVNAIFPDVNFANRELCARYAPQAEHCAALIDEYHLMLPEGGLLLERLGAYYTQYGRYADAEEALTRALALQEQQANADPLDLAQTLNTLGLLYRQEARYQEAEAQHRRALEVRERLLGAKHPKTAESLHNLALVYSDMGEYQRAEALSQRALAIEEQAKGPEHPDVARTLNSLAQIYYKQGNYAQAEAAYRRAFMIYERTRPAMHPDLIYPLDGLGVLAEREGNYARAEELYRRELAICERAYGELHPETAHSLNKLADIAEARGHYQEAETLYRRALAIGEQVLGPEHPDVALFLNNLAFVLHKQGRYRQAKELYQRALAIHERTLGPQHSETVGVRGNLEQLAQDMQDQEQEPPEGPDEGI